MKCCAWSLRPHFQGTSLNSCVHPPAPCEGVSLHYNLPQTRLYTQVSKAVGQPAHSPSALQCQPWRGPSDFFRHMLPPGCIAQRRRPMEPAAPHLLPTGIGGPKRFLPPSAASSSGQLGPSRSPRAPGPSHAQGCSCWRTGYLLLWGPCSACGAEHRAHLS